jgi:hypothetical protein
MKDSNDEFRQQLDLDASLFDTVIALISQKQDQLCMMII